MWNLRNLFWKFSWINGIPGICGISGIFGIKSSFETGHWVEFPEELEYVEFFISKSEAGIVGIHGISGIFGILRNVEE